MKIPGKVIILCGGKGMRMRAYEEDVPKALVPIGGRPIIWHVMKIYSSFGYRDFILTLGYKGDRIIEYFQRYKENSCDHTMTMRSADPARFHKPLPADEEEWNITFVHSGVETMTGGRLKRAAPYVDEPFFLATYADGLTDAPIPSIVERHAESGRMATVLGVEPPSVFGMLEIQNGNVTRFREKPHISCRISGGFFVFSRGVFDMLDDDSPALEENLLRGLSEAGQTGVFQHDGFWQCMDTPKDAMELNALWNSGSPPWKRW
jgi:glucose-1-phosphate cytidylyltransferase